MMKGDLVANHPLRLGRRIARIKEGIVDSLPQSLLEGRPGSSLLLTPHQLQQLQQLQAQQEQAGGALTLTLQHQHSAGAGCLAPQLVLAPPHSFAYPVPQCGPSVTTCVHQLSGSSDSQSSPIIQHIGHTSILQSSIQHHVRQSSIQQVIQQVGQTSIQQVGVGVGSQGMGVGSKCVSVNASPGSPFSSRSLTPSPQQRVVTPQPHQLTQVVSTPGQVLQIFHHQQATRNTVTGTGVNMQSVKPKQPPQILPKPPGSGGNSQVKVSQANVVHNSSPQITTLPQQQQGTLVFNQMLPSGPVLVQQQSSGVQLILRSPPPPPPPQPQPKSGSIVLSANGGLAPQSTAVVVQGRQQAQQVVRLITGQSLQLQQIQTSSGPTLIAVPSLQASPAPPSSNPPQQPTPMCTVTAPSPTIVKKSKKKKKKEEEPRLDLANLMKLSGIEEEDVAPVSLSQPSQQQQQTQTSHPQQQQHQQQQYVQPQSPRLVVTPPRPNTPKQQQSQLLAQLQAPSQCANQGLRLSLGEDGRMVVHTTTTQGTTGVTPTVAALARNQLAQLLAGRGGQIIQNNSNSGSNESAYLQSVQTAVFNLGGAEGIVMKGDGLALGTPSVVFNAGVRRPTNTPTSVVVANPSLIDTSQQNGVRIMTDINGISLPQQSQPGQNRIQIVPNSAVALTEHQNRVQIVSGVSNSSALSLTEHQNRVQIVSGVPSSNSVSLTEQQNRVQIVSGVQSSNAMSLTEHQNRVQIVSGVPSSPALSLTEHQNRVQIVSGVPSSSAVSLTEQQNRLQIVSSVPSSTTMSLTEQQNRLHFVSSVPSSTTMALTEQQNRVHFVSSVPSNSSLSLTEQQNRVQIVSGVQSSPSMSLGDQQNRVQIVSGVQNSSGISLTEQPNRIVVSNAPSATSMSLSEQQNRVQIVSGIPNSNTMSLTEQQNRVQIVSGTQASLTEQQNRVQIVSGMPSANTMSLTEQQNRVQIVAGVQSSNSMSLTEQQNRVQIVSAIPSSNSVALSEQNRVQIVSGIPNPNALSMNEQNRVQIVSAVPNSSGISLEQQNRVQILSGCHNSSALSLTEQQNRLQILSGVSSANTMSLTEQQNRVQIIQGVSNSNSMSLTEQQNSVQIVSGVSNSNSLSLTEQQNRVQIVAGMPNASNSLSLSEQQNRLQIVSGMANSSAISLNDQNRVHIVSGRPVNEQQNRVHLMSGIQTSNNASLTEQPNRVQVVSAVPNRSSVSFSDQNRVQLLPNVSNASSLSLCDQNRIQITQPQQTMPTTDHQNRIQVVSGVQNSSHLLNDHNRVQIVAGVPNNTLSEHGRVQLLSNSNCNDHNTVSVVTNPTEHQRIQLVTSLPNSLSEQRVQIVTSMPSDNGRLPLVSSAPLNEQQRFQIVTSLPSSNSFSDQRVQIATSLANSVSFNDRIKNSFPEQQRHQQSSGVQTIEQTVRTQTQHSSKPQHNINKSTHMQQYSQSANSPRCNHSPQSPRGGANKSPVIFPVHSPVGSPQQQTQQPARSPFPNRPNLTVVTQPQSSYHQSTTTSLHSNQSTDNPPLVNSYHQFPPAPKSISTTSHLNHQTETVNHPSVITSLANCQGVPTKPLQAVTRQPPRSTANNSSYQNSFLESIAQSHPSLVINKSPTPPVASKVFKPKKQPKKSAVVKPMMLEERQGTQTTGTSCEKDQEPPSLVPISSQSESTQTPNIHRVQTIQLTPQKQQHLKLVQSQISTLSNKKSRTPVEQSTLQRLFVEQQKILFSGKLIPTVPGQHAQGITFVSTPVRVLPTPANSPRTYPPPPPAPLPTASKATSPLHVQVGTQTTCELSPSPPVSTYNAPVQYPNRAAMIEQQLRKDRAGATAPDCNTTFASTSDACKRLVRYHCLDEPLLSHRDLEKADEIFEATARHFLDKKTQMLNKYNYLLLMESMRQVQTSELIMLGRMFVSDETTRLEHMRQEAQTPVTQNSAESTQKNQTQYNNPHTAQASNTTPAVTAIKREREDSDDEEGEVKKHCPDDEEINAQVQNAIDSILNLQKSDPALDEAVRSILTS